MGLEPSKRGSQGWALHQCTVAPVASVSPQRTEYLYARYSSKGFAQIKRVYNVPMVVELVRVFIGMSTRPAQVAAVDEQVT